MHLTKIEITEHTPGYIPVPEVATRASFEASTVRTMTIDGTPVPWVDVSAVKGFRQPTQILIRGQRVLYRTQVWFNGVLVLEDPGMLAQKGDAPTAEETS